MIITMSGEPGGGKTLTMIRMALIENRTKKVVHNIRGMKKTHIKNQHRLRKSDLFSKVPDEKRTNSKTEYFKIVPNWQFFTDNKGSTFMLDEIHTVLYSRNFSSQENKAGSMIFAEIRKICMDSGNFNDMRLLQRVSNDMFSRLIYDCIAQHNNIYATSQTTSKIEKDVRDLSQVHIHCHSMHVGDLMVVYNDFYFIDSQMTALDKFDNGFPHKRAFFIANDYFRMYDRFALVNMDEGYI